MLQNRKRIIIVGWLQGTNHHYPDLEKVEHNYKVKDLFCTLPALEPSEEINKYTHNMLNHWGLCVLFLDRMFHMTILLLNLSLLL